MRLKINLSKFFQTEWASTFYHILFTYKSQIQAFCKPENVYVEKNCVISKPSTHQIWGSTNRTFSFESNHELRAKIQISNRIRV